MTKIIIDAASQEHLLPVVNIARETEIRGRISLVAKAIDDGIKRAKSRASNLPIRVRVLHCSDMPSLILDRLIPEETGNFSPPSFKANTPAAIDATTSSHRA